MATYRPRRSAKDWQTLIHQQARSELSAKDFCTQHDLGYQSFQNWKSKLASQAPTFESMTARQPRFIELTNPSIHGEMGEAERLPASPNWLAELDLGNGVYLRVARPE